MTVAYNSSLTLQVNKQSSEKHWDDADSIGSYYLMYYLQRLFKENILLGQRKW